MTASFASGGALAIEGLPSCASMDDLSWLLSQFDGAASHRIFLSSGGVGTAGAALVLLPSPAAVDTVSELLDGHPLAGGMLECAPCADPCLWIGRHMLQVGWRSPAAAAAPCPVPVQPCPVQTRVPHTLGSPWTLPRSSCPQPARPASRRRPRERPTRQGPQLRRRRGQPSSRPRRPGPRRGASRSQRRRRLCSSSCRSRPAKRPGGATRRRRQPAAAAGEPGGRCSGAPATAGSRWQPRLARRRPSRRRAGAAAAAARCRPAASQLSSCSSDRSRQVRLAVPPAMLQHHTHLPACLPVPDTLPPPPPLPSPQVSRCRS